MRVMFSVPSYWPSQDGVANITGYLAEGLAARGHDVLIYTSMGNGGLQELPENEHHAGVNIERIRVYVNWPFRLKGRDEKSTEKKYYERIKQYNPDVLIVVCSQTWTLDWLVPYLKKLDMVKIFYSHGYSKWSEHYPFLDKIRNRNILGIWDLLLCKKYYDKLYKYIRLFDKAIYLSKENNSYVYAQKNKLENDAVLENAIDDIFFEKNAMREKGKKQQEEIVYLYVANYNANKNQEMLVKAFGDAKLGKSRLVFAGYEDCEYLQYIKEIAKESIAGQEQKKIDFYVHLPRKEIIELYYEADVFVCPSKSETWSIVAHEAAAAALPIISTDVGIYSEIESAYIVKNQQEMAIALQKLYENEAERIFSGEMTLRWLMGQNCRIEDKVDWLENELFALLKEKI